MITTTSANPTADIETFHGSSLELKNLTMAYGDIEVLRNVSLSVAPGTTTMRDLLQPGSAMAARIPTRARTTTSSRAEKPCLALHMMAASGMAGQYCRSSARVKS